jgi:hypothetical protein
MQMSKSPIISGYDDFEHEFVDPTIRVDVPYLTKKH